KFIVIFSWVIIMSSVKWFLGRKHCNTGHDDDLFFLHNYMDLIIFQQSLAYKHRLSVSMCLF
ncbi:hypothetical protein, partial [Robertmurraya sp. Marseille-Q9965]